MARYHNKQLREAATVKARCQRMVRDMDEMLKDKSLPSEMRHQMETLRASLRKTWKELATGAQLANGRKGLTTAEADPKKTIDGTAYPAGDFLVVPDAEKPTTWSLQVKRNGKVDRRLLGAAHAALTVGFRGNKYEGPDKGKAMAKLKKLYDDEGMPFPDAKESAAAQPDGEEVAEGYYPETGESWVPWGVISFAQLEATHAAREMADELQERAAQFSQMVNNILAADALTVPDKPAAMRSLFDEFMLTIEDALTPEGEDTGMMDAAESQPAEETTPASVSGETVGETAALAESYAAGAVLLSEASPDTLTMMDVQIIQPGWGNSRDNHFYSAEMLRRDAEKFVGAKMYETDHRPEEKNTKNWVSTVKEIVRFTAEGAPVARVAIHDPSFSERVRNLAATNLLEKMECSILANGQAAPFELNGRKGKAVQAITEVSSVDWVTKAGAGGKALNLAEADAQPEDNQSAAPSESAPVSASAPPPAPDPVVIHEQQPETAAGITPETAEAAPDTPAAEAQPPAPVYLAEAAVAEALAKTNLPAASALALLKGEYLDAASLSSAISAETKRIKEISGSGKPFAMGESSAVSTAVKPISRKQIEETMDKVNSKFLGR